MILLKSRGIDEIYVHICVNWYRRMDDVGNFLIT